MLRTIILSWLVICTFGYGSVMAFDTHLDIQGQHESHADSSIHVDSGEDQPDCDHCCHSSAHTTGLSYHQPVVDTLRADIGLPSYYVAYYFLSTDPPDHPPRS